MAKVFAREQVFIGLGNNREAKILKGELYDDNDPLVLAYPDLFTPVAESTDARVAALEARIAELTAEQTPTKPADKPADKPASRTTAKKATAAATGAEIKGEVL